MSGLINCVVVLFYFFRANERSRTQEFDQERSPLGVGSDKSLRERSAAASKGLFRIEDEWLRTVEKYTKCRYPILETLVGKSYGQFPLCLL